MDLTGLDWRLGGTGRLRIGARNAITDVTGIRVGHAGRAGDGWLTGSTVVFGGEAGVTAAVDARGGGTATREIGALDPTGVVERIHAVYLGGGSAYGLDAAGGVMAGLAERGLGFVVGSEPTHVVPVVPSATLFDLGRGGDFFARPDAALAREALEAALASDDGAPVAEGSVGAGTGAVAGEIRGGVGTASVVLPGGGVVGALVVVNSAGSTVNQRTGLPWGELFELPHDDGRPEFGLTPPDDAARRRALDALAALSGGRLPMRPLNTTLAVIATDIPLSRGQLLRLAGCAHDGMARAIRPIHTLSDGDVVFGMSTGTGPWPPAEGPLESLHPSDQVNQVLAAGADVIARAIVHAVIAADPVTTPMGHVPSYRTMYT
ncbi:MAG TPA: P1 family peptidase [Microbacterium sp.]|uniref:P1 family peptidase n=1 Tax=Microbacterium sp. TaxID=51671 RepID=UPI002D0315BD|nr:P1 family peptidase [Microbacterium sp.]HWI31055.1 P1 family peptidase [Microbacterium sp.]